MKIEFLFYFGKRVQLAIRLPEQLRSKRSLSRLLDAAERLMRRKHFEEYCA